MLTYEINSETDDPILGKQFPTNSELNTGNWKQNQISKPNFSSNLFLLGVARGSRGAPILTPLESKLNTYTF